VSSELLARLHKAEAELGIEPDMCVDALMEACSQEGSSSITTDFLLRMLGLGICADTMVRQPHFSRGHKYLWAGQGYREIYFKSHISLWEHSSHFRLIGRGVPSVSVVSQLMYKFLCLASPKENPQVPM